MQNPETQALQYNLANKPLSAVLDGLIKEAAGFPMAGIIDGAIVLDGDGRTLATAGRYRRRNIWEIAALSAVLPGFATQGQTYL